LALNLWIRYSKLILIIFFNDAPGVILNARVGYVKQYNGRGSKNHHCLIEDGMVPKNERTSRRRFENLKEFLAFILFRNMGKLI
jgi:hypothetical protein